jgi:sulfofructose kinase
LLREDVTGSKEAEELRFDAVGIESPCVDMAVNVDVFPKPNGSAEIKNMSWQGGGKVATGMAAAARLGVKGAVIGSVGDDGCGKFITDDFIRHGIDTTYLLKRTGKKTNFSLVMSDRETMGRSIIFRRGNAEPIEKREVPEEYLKNTDYFYVASLNDTAIEAAKRSKGYGAKIFIDADYYSEELKRFIPETDIFIASEFVYKALFSSGDIESNCRRITEMGPKTVIFTFGEKGCEGVSEDGYFKVPAYSVDAVDTVGAGDVFHGAYLASIIKGLSAEEAARTASAVSAIKCTRIGGRAGIPDWDTAVKFMKTGVVDYTEIDRRVDFYRKGIALD